MRGRQLQQLVADFRAEAGLSTRAEVGVDHLDGVKHLLRRAQEMLYDSYDWPHLRKVFPKIQLSAGQVLYDLPAGLDYTRVEDVVVWHDDTPRRLSRGIDLLDYGDDERSDPACKYDIRESGQTAQIEVWPTPLTNTQQLQIQGVRKLAPLIEDTDVCDMDATAVVLFAAADYLAGVKAANAEFKAGAARDRMAMLRARSMENRESTSFLPPSHEWTPLKLTVR